MGRQSSRIYFQGKDHKDIYFQGHYHDKMYIGSQLVWEKIKGGKWRLEETNTTFPLYNIVFGNGIFLSAIQNNGLLHIRTSCNGVDWTDYTYDWPFGNGVNIIVFFANNIFFIVSASGLVKTTNGESISDLINSVTFNTSSFTGEAQLSGIGATYPETKYASDGDYIYVIKKYVPGVPSGYLRATHGVFVYRSSDGEIWNCINAELNVWSSSSSVFRELIGDYYPRDNDFSAKMIKDGIMYGKLMKGDYSSSVHYPSTFKTKYGYTDFKSYSDMFTDCNYFYAYKNRLSMVNVDGTWKYSINLDDWYEDILEHYSIPIHGTSSPKSDIRLYNDDYKVMSFKDGNYVTHVLLDEDCNLIDYESYENDKFTVVSVVYGNGIFLVTNQYLNENTVYIRTEV